VCPETETPAKTRVSIVVPCFHSHETLGDCLQALRAQSFQEFEVIVVNSSAEGQTARIVAERFPEARFEQSPRRLLPHAARNRGVALARGEVIVFTDPDCVAGPNWLAALLAAVERGHQVVSGALALRRQGLMEWAAHLHKFSHWLPGLPKGPRRVAPTANACLSAEVWQLVGPFPDYLSGDSLLCWRAAGAGAQPWFEPRAIVAHSHGASPAAFLTERFARGRDFALMRAHTERWSTGRTAAYLCLLALKPPLDLLFIARNALAARWTGRFILTLPLLVAACVAWSLGEAEASRRLLWALLRSRAAPRPSPS
jgi:GT2 family glycosyltransferase